MKSLSISPKTKKIIIGAVIALVVIAIIVGLAVGLSKKPATSPIKTAPSTTSPVVDNSEIYFGKLSGSDVPYCSTVSNIGKIDINNLLILPTVKMVRGKPTIQLKYDDTNNLSVDVLSIIYETKSIISLIVKINDNPQNKETINLIESKVNYYGNIMKISNQKIYKLNFINSGPITATATREYKLEGTFDLLPLKSINLEKGTPGEICNYMPEDMVTGANILSFVIQSEYIFNLETIYDIRSYLFP